MSAGRYAPTPSGPLHLGNLRTAIVAWMLARRTSRDFLIRIEDLDQVRTAAAGAATAQSQLADLAALGLDWDGDIVCQSDRSDLYATALEQLDVYECFCTRREIAEATSAPHGTVRPYPGTCRNLTEAERAERRAVRPAALRVRAHGARVSVHDRWVGEVTGVVDDFVVRRGDGAWAYNLAVVVDDGEQGIDQVCRGNDLLESAPRQAWLARQLGYPVPEYAHVGLVLGPTGQRLAKRDGAVTLAELASPRAVCGWVASSLGLNPSLGTAVDIARAWDGRPVATVTWRPEC